PAQPRLGPGAPRRPHATLWARRKVPGHGERPADPGPPAAHVHPASVPHALDGIRPSARAGPHLTPEHRARAAARDLREREREGGPCGLRHAGRREEAALPADEPRLVPDEEPNQQG